MADGGFGLSFDGLTIWRPRPPGVCILRLAGADAALFRALGAACGVVWPVTPNVRAQAKDGLTVLWTGPLEWTLIGQLADELAKPLAGRFHLLTDVTAGRTCFEISGPRSRELLAKGCSLDIHPKVFGDAHCAQTLLAQVPVLLHRTPSEDAFQLLVDASLASYLNAWLADAASEYIR